MSVQHVNGMQIADPQLVLTLGARIFHINENTQEGWIELPLTEYFKQDKDNGWNLAGAALIEARRLGHVSSDAEHPSGIIGEVRRWFLQWDELYKDLEDPKKHVFLVIRPGVERLFRKWVGGGRAEFIPVARWSVKVTIDE
jgi:hypothetical protein